MGSCMTALLKLNFFIYIFLIFCLNLRKLDNPSKTQCCDNVVWRCNSVVLRSQRCTTNTQRCSVVDDITSKLQRCSKFMSTLDRKFNSRCNINVALTNFLQRWNWDVKFTTSLQRRYYKVKFTTFYQHCLNVG